jgi:hypothetical protein
VGNAVTNAVVTVNTLLEMLKSKLSTWGSIDTSLLLIKNRGLKKERKWCLEDYTGAREVKIFYHHMYE